MQIFNKITDLFVKVKDVSGNGITSTDLGAGKRGLDISGTINATVDKARIRDATDQNKMLVVDANGNIGVVAFVSGTPIDPRNIRALTASDIISAVQSGSWNITNILGTVSLPTGAATEATILAILNKMISGSVIGDVNASQKGTWNVNVASGGEMVIRDYANPLYRAQVDASGNLKVVTPAPVAPPGKTAVFDQDGPSSVPGSAFVDKTYIIPNGQTLTVQTFFGGSQGDANSSKIILYYCPNGTVAGAGTEILAHGYVASSNYEKALNRDFTGNGTRAIIIRRQRLDGTAKEMFAKWEGYY